MAVQLLFDVCTCSPHEQPPNHKIMRVSRLSAEHPVSEATRSVPLPLVCPDRRVDPGPGMGNSPDSLPQVLRVLTY